MTRFSYLFASAILLPTCQLGSAQLLTDVGIPRFDADARIVLVPTTVTDRKNAFVNGLTPKSFVVTQDSIPQSITFFGEQDIPVSLGVVFDTSGSMTEVLGEAKTLLRGFFSVSNPEDEAFLFTVSSAPQMKAGFTTDLPTLLEQTMFSDAGGSTALVDTIYAALRQTRDARHTRKALLVISDGMDNHSAYSKSALFAAAVETDVQIYSITVSDPPRNRKPIELQEEREGLSFLADLARRTGGMQIVVHDAREVNQAVLDMGRLIRDQYMIGYVPQHSNADGRWHSIKVRLNLANASAHARTGFYSR